MVRRAPARRRRPAPLHQSVSAILRFANHHKIPVTPRGAGHGYVGGCVPVRGGIVLSLERMNRIKEINAADFVAVVQPAVITQNCRRRSKNAACFIRPTPPAARTISSAATSPPTPAARAASNTASPAITSSAWKSCWPTAPSSALGGRTHKNKTGFDLHRLFVGSEGTARRHHRSDVETDSAAAVPRQPRRRLWLHEKRRPRAAGDFGRRLSALRAGTGRRIHARRRLPTHQKRTPARLPRPFDRRTGWPGKVRPARIAGFGTNHPPAEAAVRRARLRRRRMRGNLANPPRIFLRPARHRPDQIERGHRRAARPAGGPFQVRGADSKRNTACPSPVSATPATATSTPTSWWTSTSRGADRRAEAALDELFAQVIAWGGAISGEHGIGLAKKRWWPLAVSKEARELHRAVKHALDPKGILNPGKFV